MAHIDLNCDLGESFGTYTMGNDEAVIPLITSCNIACGYHAGDPSVMQKTVALAKAAGVHIGAHPGYHDLQGFGRRPMDISPDEAYDLMVYQVGALMGVCASQKTRLSHVKPHGALYNRAAAEPDFAHAVAQAIFDLDPDLILVGLANGCLIDAAQELGLASAQEYFVDRNYNDEGQLADRSKPGALITDDDIAVKRAIQVIEHGEVESINGKLIDIHADTICVHGDGAQALRFVERIRKDFTDTGIDIAPMGR